MPYDITAKPPANLGNQLIHLVYLIDYAIEYRSRVDLTLLLERLPVSPDMPRIWDYSEDQPLTPTSSAWGDLPESPEIYIPYERAMRAAEIIRPYLALPAPVAVGETIINIRSGADLFGASPIWKDDGRYYRQPPMAYFLRCMEQEADHAPFAVMTTPDELNPCYGLLVRSYPRCYGASLSPLADFSRLMHARCIISGHSSFTFAAMLLSTHLQRAYVPARWMLRRDDVECFTLHDRAYFNRPWEISDRDTLLRLSSYAAEFRHDVPLID